MSVSLNVISFWFIPFKGKCILLTGLRRGLLFGCVGWGRGFKGHTSACIEFETLLHPNFQNYLESLIPIYLGGGGSVIHIGFCTGYPALTHRLCFTFLHSAKYLIAYLFGFQSSKTLLLPSSLTISVSLWFYVLFIFLQSF